MKEQILDFLQNGLYGLIPVLIYLVLGFVTIVLALARFYRYFGLQQERALILFAVVNLFQGGALIAASFAIVPHPAKDYSWLIPYVRLAWGASIPFFVAAVHLECMLLADLIHKRGSGPVDSGQKNIQEPYQDTATTGPTE